MEPFYVLSKLRKAVGGQRGILRELRTTAVNGKPILPIVRAGGDAGGGNMREMRDEAGALER
jgi:hypothetical protein